MGVGIQVGMLHDLRVHDQEGYQWLQEQLDHVSARLNQAGFDDHREPETLSETFSCDLMGYGGLHRLRRLAAWLAVHDSLPKQSIEKPLEDPIYAELYFLELEKNPQIGFQHLINHSDSEGFYVPVEFPHPLPHDEETKFASGPIGSTFRLLEECQDISRHLEIPIEDDDYEACFNKLFPSSNKAGFFQRLFSRRTELPKSQLKWKSFHSEAYVCLQMLRACQFSMTTGAAIAFC